MSRFPLYKLIRRSLTTTWNFNIRNIHKPKLRTSIQSLSSLCHDSSGVRTRIALPVDYDRVIDFMHKTYFKTEPSLLNIGLTDCEEPPPPLVHVMREHVKEGMTIIAESSDNCIIGAAVNAGSCPWDPEKMIEFAECCCEPGLTRDVIKFYAHVTSQPKLWDRYCVLKIYECRYLSVDSQYLGMGIGRRLARESWHLARDCGYQVFRIDCTSKYNLPLCTILFKSYSAKIAEGFGWKCLFSMSYRRYIDSGGLVFKHIQEPHTEVRVYADQPLICKDYCNSNPDDCKIGSVPDAK